MHIYLDMDGVIADFFTLFAKKHNVTHWKSITDKELALASLRNTNFFYEIPLFMEDDESISHKIVNYVKTKAAATDNEWGICSSPLRNDHNNSAFWKRLWLVQHKIMPKVENCIFTSNKHKYAISPLDGKPNILIDDKVSNIIKWENAGGIGIRFQCNEDDVEDYLFPGIDSALEQINKL